MHRYNSPITISKQILYAIYIFNVNSCGLTHSHSISLPVCINRVPLSDTNGRSSPLSWFVRKDLWHVTWHAVRLSDWRAGRRSVTSLDLFKTCGPWDHCTATVKIIGLNSTNLELKWWRQHELECTELERSVALYWSLKWTLVSCQHITSENELYCHSESHTTSSRHSMMNNIAKLDFWRYSYP